MLVEMESAYFVQGFSQQEIDNALYGYIRGFTGNSSTAHALSDIEFKQVSNGKLLRLLDILAFSVFLRRNKEKYAFVLI